jgi:hypothetical protein
MKGEALQKYFDKPRSIDIEMDNTWFDKGLVFDGDEIEIGYSPHKLKATVHRISPTKSIIRTFPYTITEIGAALRPRNI